MLPNSPTWEPPRPFNPATPTRTVSLAPSTLPDDLVPATVMVAAAARDDSRKRRRVRRMRGLEGMRKGWGLLEQDTRTCRRPQMEVGRTPIRVAATQREAR